MNQPRNANWRSLKVLLILFFVAASGPTLMVACTDDDVDQTAIDPGRMMQPRVEREARGDVDEPPAGAEGPLYTPSQGDSMTFDDQPSERSASNLELGEDFETSGDYGESLEGETLDEFEPVTEGEDVEISAASDDEIEIEGSFEDDESFSPVANEDLDESESFSPMVEESTQPIDDDAYLTEFEEDTESFSPVANESPDSESMTRCDPSGTEPLGSWGEPSPNRFGLGETITEGRQALTALVGPDDELGGWGSGDQLASGGWIDLSGLIAEARVALSDANDVVIASAEAGGFDMNSYEPVQIAEVDDDSDDFQSVSYESDDDNACVPFQTTDAWGDDEE